MWHWIIEHLYTEPDRMIGRGQACANVALAMLLTGIIGWAVKQVLAVAQRHTPHALPQNLAELWDMPLLTWWIPESVGAVLLALCLLGFGVWLTAAGRQLKRVYYG